MRDALTRRSPHPLRHAQGVPGQVGFAVSFAVDTASAVPAILAKNGYIGAASIAPGEVELTPLHQNDLEDAAVTAPSMA